MENWGLVTYRETALLVDPNNSSLQSKQNVAIVVGKINYINFKAQI
jgi:puromycin-sensitive aminopeptidase